jgi:hypothetical protein
MSKLLNFPTVNYITLYENTARMEFMNEQLTKFGIRYMVWLNHRYTTFAQSVDIEWPQVEDAHAASFQGFSHPGTIISYLTAMRCWYDTTNEEYAIFCDDDMSFESINHWSFTWQEFVDKLPTDWEAVHLVRINNWHVGLINNAIKFEMPTLQLRKKEWDDFGGAGLFTREYIKKILDRHWIDFLKFDFKITCKNNPGIFYFATIENALFTGLCDTVYNVPLLLEHPFPTTMNVERMLYSHDRSYEYYSTLWKMYGTDLPLWYIMNQP